MFFRNRKINEKLDLLNNVLEKSNLKAMVAILGNKKQVFWRNFLGGIARGIGMAIGFTVLGAIVIYSLQYIVKLNLPIIGKYVSDIVKIVEEDNSKK